MSKAKKRPSRKVGSHDLQFILGWLHEKAEYFAEIQTVIAGIRRQPDAKMSGALYQAARAAAKPHVSDVLAHQSAKQLKRIKVFVGDLRRMSRGSDTSLFSGDDFWDDELTDFLTENAFVEFLGMHDGDGENLAQDIYKRVGEDPDGCCPLWDELEEQLGVSPAGLLAGDDGDVEVVVPPPAS